eukprot:7383850-Prymnesium_polylepis.5
MRRPEPQGYPRVTVDVHAQLAKHITYCRILLGLIKCRTGLCFARKVHLCGFRRHTKSDGSKRMQQQDMEPFDVNRQKKEVHASLPNIERGWPRRALTCTTQMTPLELSRFSTCTADSSTEKNAAKAAPTAARLASSKELQLSITANAQRRGLDWGVAPAVQKNVVAVFKGAEEPPYLCKRRRLQDT